MLAANGGDKSAHPSHFLALPVTIPKKKKNPKSVKEEPGVSGRAKPDDDSR